MSSFHDEWVTESDGDRKRFGGENGVCRVYFDGFVMSAFAVRVYFDTGNVTDRLCRVGVLRSDVCRSPRVTDAFMVAAPVTFLTLFAAVPDCVACRAATGSSLIAVVVRTAVFPSHCAA